MKLEIETIRNEKERGCGYRKEGGMYMMSAGPTASCGKLPLELTVCPCCGAGIKPARGFTWIDAQELFKDVECDYADATVDGCHHCPLGNANLEKHPRMGLVWLGSKHYPTAQDFLQEARSQGVSRRIPAVPKDFVIGETFVLFAHRDVIEKSCNACDGKGWNAKMVQDPETGGDAVKDEPCEHCKGKGKVYDPAIIGCFKPDRIEYVVGKKDTKKKLKRLQKRGLKLVKLEWDEEEEDEQPELIPDDRPLESIMDDQACDRCGQKAELYYYNDEALCANCENEARAEDDPDEHAAEMEEELRRDMILEQQEREDFAQDDYMHNIPGDEIL